MERIAAALVWSTPVRRRMWRLRLVVFLVRMWRLYAPARLIEPLPRTLKRLAAPRLDFILGMTSLPLSFRMTPGGPRSAGTLQKPRLSLMARYARAGFAATLGAILGASFLDASVLVASVFVASCFGFSAFAGGAEKPKQDATK